MEDSWQDYIEEYGSSGSNPFHPEDYSSIPFSDEELAQEEISDPPLESETNFEQTIQFNSILELRHFVRNHQSFLQDYVIVLPLGALGLIRNPRKQDHPTPKSDSVCLLTRISNG